MKLRSTGDDSLNPRRCASDVLRTWPQLRLSKPSIAHRRRDVAASRTFVSRRRRQLAGKPNKNSRENGVILRRETGTRGTRRCFGSNPKDSSVAPDELSIYFCSVEFDVPRDNDERARRSDQLDVRVKANRTIWDATPARRIALTQCMTRW